MSQSSDGTPIPLLSLPLTRPSRNRSQHRAKQPTGKSLTQLIPKSKFDTLTDHDTDNPNHHAKTPSPSPSPDLSPPPSPPSALGSSPPPILSPDEEQMYMTIEPAQYIEEDGKVSELEGKTMIKNLEQMMGPACRRAFQKATL